MAVERLKTRSVRISEDLYRYLKFLRDEYHLGGISQALLYVLSGAKE